MLKKDFVEPRRIGVEVKKLTISTRKGKLGSVYIKCLLFLPCFINRKETKLLSGKLRYHSELGSPLYYPTALILGMATLISATLSNKSQYVMASA